MWLNDDRMLTVNNTGIIVNNCLNRCKLNINKLSVHELFHLEKEGKCHYECLSLKYINTMYYDINTSLEALFRLLIFQFHDLDTVRNFLITIYYFLDRHLDEGKKNTILIVGPPNSGKNFFVDCLGSYTLNVGKIENPSRQNQFPWMGALIGVLTNGMKLASIHHF